MLSQPNFSQEDIEKNLKVGDLVDWLGQDSLVLGIDRVSEKPVRIKNLVGGNFESVRFEDINDITDNSVNLHRYLVLTRELIRDRVKSLVS